MCLVYRKVPKLKLANTAVSPPRLGHFAKSPKVRTVGAKRDGYIRRLHKIIRL